MVRPDQSADIELGDELEAPARNADVVPMASIREVEVEDRLEGFGGCGDEGVVADVDPLVGECGDEFDALRSKGMTTFSPYSSSAASPTAIAMSRFDSSRSSMA